MRPKNSNFCVQAFLNRYVEQGRKAKSDESGKEVTKVFEKRFSFSLRILNSSKKQEITYQVKNAKGFKKAQLFIKH